MDGDKIQGCESRRRMDYWEGIPALASPPNPACYNLR